MTPHTTSLALFIIFIVTLTIGGMKVYRDGFVDGVRWMLRGDQHPRRPHARWREWPRMKAIRSAVKEGWYRRNQAETLGCTDEDITEEVARIRRRLDDRDT